MTGDLYFTKNVNFSIQCYSIRFEVNILVLFRIAEIVSYIHLEIFWVMVIAVKEHLTHTRHVLLEGPLYEISF